MPLTALLAVLFDRLFGEVRRWHPLVGFGNLAGAIEKKLNRRTLLAGVVAWLLAVAPWVVLAFSLLPQRRRDDFRVARRPVPSRLVVRRPR